MEDPVGVHPQIELERMDKPGYKRGIPYKERILVTGDTGFVGMNLLASLKQTYPQSEILTINGSKTFNLVSQGDTSMMIKKYEPNIIVHTAALTPGRPFVKVRPANLLYDNIIMVLNLLEAAANLGHHTVSRIIIVTDHYSDFILKAVEAYRKQWSQEITLVPTPDLIGPWDNFHPQHCRFIPMMITRMIEARENKYENVQVPYSANEVYKFLYIKDFTNIISDIIKIDSEYTHVNVSPEKYLVSYLMDILKSTTECESNLVYGNSRFITKTKLEGSGGVSVIPTKSNYITDVETVLLETVNWYINRCLK